jgi:hypothetical protein
MNVPLNQVANLVRRGRRLYVRFDGEHYARAELVPTSILGRGYHLPDPPKVFTATAFVAARATRKYGPISEWPEEAVEFIFPKAFSVMARATKALLKTF